MAGKSFGSPPSSHSYPPAGVGYRVLLALMLASVVSALDRQILSLLVTHVHRDLALSDTQIGLLQGFSFAVLYALAALPAGYASDRGNRRNVLLAGLVFWSLMTVVCGFARNFQELFIARMGVGLGEACLGPAAVSILGDYFAPGRRGRVMALYQMGTYVGGGASIVVGALILAVFHDAFTVAVPVLGVVATWKLVFFAAGAIGLAFAPILLGVREPERHETAGTVSKLSLGAIGGMVSGRFAPMRMVYLAYSLVVFVGFGFTAWAPAYLIRGFHLAPSRAGLLVGVLTSVSGMAGCIVSGWLADRWTRLGVVGQKFRVTVLGWALVAPGLVWFPLAATPTVALVALSVVMFGNAILISSAPAVINDAYPNEKRGLGVAIFFICQATFGISLGPLGVAAFNDAVLGGHDVGRSLLIVLAPSALVGLMVSVFGQRAYQRLRDAFTVQA